MKLKKLFLGVAVALGLVSVSATTVNAEEATPFVEDFNNQSTRGELGSAASANKYTVFSTAAVTGEVLKLDTQDNEEVLYYGVEGLGESAPTGTQPKVTFRKTWNDQLYTGKVDTVIKTRFKLLRGYGSKVFGIYHKTSQPKKL